MTVPTRHDGTLFTSLFTTR